MNETIFALASAAGRAGVAVIRVSGPAALTSLALLTDRPLPPVRQAATRRLRHPVTHAVLDHALVLHFAGPASFTGEDVVEYHLHGGRAVIDGVLDVLGAVPGHRLAAPGEFTRRAFEHGKLDLTAAEAIADLVNAETEAQKMQALDQLGGGLAALYEGWAARLIRALAYVEADLDFPDEDLPDGVAGQVRPGLLELQREIAVHLQDNRRGEILRDGVYIAVIGAPNAGKSSLVNALAQREIAIVSPHAGTTRDVIEAHLNLGGYPVILADTAGLRPDQLGETAHDMIEGEGIRRALDRARAADLKILLFDATVPPDAATLQLRDQNALLVFNKSDLLDNHNPRLHGDDVLEISVNNGAGLTQLTMVLIEKIRSLLGTRSAPPLTRRRHRAALEESASALARALENQDAELIAEETRLALRALGRITGRVDIEDLLDIIFRDFCIGK